MTNTLVLLPRDRSLLKLLSWTPATTGLLWRASSAFDDGSFKDERRLRERLQTLKEAGFVRFWSAGMSGGGLQHYYKLTPPGFQTLYGTEVPLPSRAYFSEISPSLFAHTLSLAEVIVTTVRASREQGIEVVRFYRENELTFDVGEASVQPDGFFRLASSGRFFNVALELDQSTESVDSFYDQSVRNKLALYDAYQASVLNDWLAKDRNYERPRFRVAFFTRSVERAYHILSLAAELTQHPARRLVYAIVQDSFVHEADSLRQPIFLDHLGHWQALVNPHPTSPFQRTPVRLTPLTPPTILW